jgi:hypothetical protein
MDKHLTPRLSAGAFKSALKTMFALQFPDFEIESKSTGKPSKMAFDYAKNLLAGQMADP